MARPLRLEFSGALYHVTSRGNQGSNVFPDDDFRRAFLDILYAAVNRFNWICHSYCLMGNHYHLVIETPEGNLSKGMRQVNGVYTQHVNRRQKTGGHLFQGRYKSILVEKESHFLEVIRYVVLNPVRAGLVSSPAEWEWSSYRGLCGLASAHPCVTAGGILERFGSGPGASFRSFVADGIGKPSPLKNAAGSVILGGAAFRGQLEPQLKRAAEASEIPVSQRLAGRPELAQLFTEGSRGKRDRAIHAAVETWGYSQKVLADFLGLHYSTISRIVSRVAAAAPVTPAPAPPISIAETPKVASPPKTVKPTTSPATSEKRKALVDQLSLFS